MGVALRDITIRHETELERFSGKVLSVDAANILYQFLASIRQRDGAALTDSKGRVTSHLIGLLSRTSRLLQHNIKLVFVFDGKPPELKRKELERRSKLKEKAYEEFKKAVAEDDVSGMHRYAARTSRLTPEMIQSAKDLLDALGVPWLDAPCEGEAQAAHLVKKGDAYACISQDYDNLLFGVPRLIQNATLSEKRKLPSKLAYETVKPQLIDLEENLKVWGISHRQLIALGLLIGTDFNPSGIPKIGPKKGLALVKEFREDFDALFTHVQWDTHYPYPYTEAFKTLEEMPVSDTYTLRFGQVDEEKLIRLLCDGYEFSRERVANTIENLRKAEKSRVQSSLFDF